MKCLNLAVLALATVAKTSPIPEGQSGAVNDHKPKTPPPQFQPPDIFPDPGDGGLVADSKSRVDQIPHASHHGIAFPEDNSIVADSKAHVDQIPHASHHGIAFPEDSSIVAREAHDSIPHASHHGIAFPEDDSNVADPEAPVENIPHTSHHGIAFPEGGGSFVAHAAMGKTGKKPENVIPSCAIPCLEAYIQKHTKCKLDDYKCVCRHKEVKDRRAVTCVIDECGFSQSKNKVYPAVKQFCKGWSGKN